MVMACCIILRSKPATSSFFVEGIPIMKLLAQRFLLSLILCSLEIPVPAKQPLDNSYPLPFLLSPTQEAVEWERFSTEGEEFSVLLPITPSISTYNRPMASKNRLEDGRIYSSYQDGTVYVIISIDNPNRRDSLQTIRDEILTNELQQILVINATRTETQITRTGVKGVQYRSTNDHLSSISEFYIADNHVYFFGVYSEDINQSAVKQFLSSIAVGAKAKAKRVKDTSRIIIKSPAAPPPSGTPENKVFTTRDVTRKALIITRPQPQYTEEARQNEVTGTVVLRGVFSSTGSVTNIKAVKGLPDGLTEKAIAAARNIKFIPARKEGRFVSQYIQIEYNFNLY